MPDIYEGTVPPAPDTIAPDTIAPAPAKPVETPVKAKRQRSSLPAFGVRVRDRVNRKEVARIAFPVGTSYAELPAIIKTRMGEVKAGGLSPTFVSGQLVLEN